ncbi:MAG: hypothetical protein ACKPKO_05050 [Candidatus Fonsibacter sp.]
MGDYIDLSHRRLQSTPKVCPMTPPPSRRGLSPPTQTPKWTYTLTPKSNPKMWKPSPVPSPIWRAQGKADAA